MRSIFYKITGGIFISSNALILSQNTRLSGIKKLAGHTLWYGVPKIFSRFLNYGLTLLGFRLFDAATTSDLTQVYAIIPFLNVVFTYGLETSYFRFAQLKDKQTLYNTLSVSITATTILFTLVLFLFKDSVTSFFELKNHPQYVTWMIWIIFFDTLAVIPLSKLRLEERPAKYALINVASIFLNIAIVFFFLFVARKSYESDPYSFPGILYNPEIGVGYFILANLIASAVTLLFLLQEIKAIRFVFNKQIWKEVMVYSYPLIIVGFGGMINEMLSRVIYKKVAVGTALQQDRELGIFGANYKLAVLITIFIQIFRLAAEPFFFNQSGREDAKRTYSRVMKFFVIACCFMFLVIALFLNFWQILIASKFKEYAEGIHIVPVLAMASVFLGIYYNLSIWYKLTNKNMSGAYITIAGAVVTIILNIWWIPIFGYTGSAWATFICYAFMMATSYVLGQKYYPIPYAKKKLITYLAISVLLYIIHEFIAGRMDNDWKGYHFIYYGTAALFIVLFALLILRVEAKELQRLPYIGRLVYRTKIDDISLPDQEGVI
ncbi:MAG: polysaccharide biosynthesis C-terminal domain-containing protein [Chitinophagaceae bacterium]|nr:polysaccharide biosynthesis C-terminal domain-containing protein [Chitinophagaceae bacterium]